MHIEKTRKKLYHYRKRLRLLVTEKKEKENELRCNPKCNINTKRLQ